LEIARCAEERWKLVRESDGVRGNVAVAFAIAAWKSGLHARGACLHSSEIQECDFESFVPTLGGEWTSEHARSLGQTKLSTGIRKDYPALDDRGLLLMGGPGR